MSKKKSKDATRKPKQTSLSATDKKRLRAAYEAALNDLPQADTPTGLTADGSKITLRDVFKRALDNGSIFKSVGNMMNNKVATLDQILFDMKRNGLGIPKIRS